MATVRCSGCERYIMDTDEKCLYCNTMNAHFKGSILNKSEYSFESTNLPTSSVGSSDTIYGATQLPTGAAGQNFDYAPSVQPEDDGVDLDDFFDPNGTSGIESESGEGNFHIRRATIGFDPLEDRGPNTRYTSSYVGGNGVSDYATDKQTAEFILMQTKQKRKKTRNRKFKVWKLFPFVVILIIILLNWNMVSGLFSSLMGIVKSCLEILKAL